MRVLIKALEAQGRGFAHGHEKFHSEPKTKAIDLIELFLGVHGSGAPEHEHDRGQELVTWMDAHRAACLQDAATKQYDSAVEPARHVGCSELQEVFTAEEKRCILDGGEEEDGTQRLPDVDVVPALEPAHVLRERTQAADEGRAMRHPYRGMPLTGAPAARFPSYLLASQFDAYADLEENGNAPETFEVGSPARATGCNTRWVDPARVYVSDTGGGVQGIRKADGTMASEEELQVDAWRYRANFAADTCFCHVLNHS